MKILNKIYNTILVAIFIVVTLLPIIILSKMVFASSFNYTIGYSQLPYNTSKEVTLTGIENLSITINYDYFLYGNIQKNFTSNQTNLLIYIYVPSNISAINYTQQVQIIGSLNNNSYNTNISFNFFILNDTVINYTEYIQIDINEFEYPMICDYLLPLNLTKQIVVKGVYGQIIQTMYNSRFFTLPNEFTIPAENYSIIDVMIHFDENLTKQVYTEKIQFNIVSKYANVTFHFNIADCVMPITVCNELADLMGERCGKINKTSDDMLECKKRTIEYDKCVYDAMLSAREKYIVNNTIIEYINETQYKDILSDDPNIIAIFRDVIATWNQFKSDVNTLKKKDDEINTLKDEKSTVWEEANKRMVESTVDLVDENILKQNIINNYNKKYMKKSTLYWLLLFWLPIICGSVFLFFVIRDNYWW